MLVAGRGCGDAAWELGADVLLSARPVPHWSQDRVTPLHRVTHPSAPQAPGTSRPYESPLPQSVSPPRDLFSLNHMDCKHVAGAAFPESPTLAGEKGSVWGVFLPGNLGSIDRSAWGVPRHPYPMSIAHAQSSIAGEGRSQWHSFAGLEQALENPIEKLRSPPGCHWLPAKKLGTGHPNPALQGSAGGLCVALGARQ